MKNKKKAENVKVIFKNVLHEPRHEKNLLLEYAKTKALISCTVAPLFSLNR